MENLSSPVLSLWRQFISSLRMLFPFTLFTFPWLVFPSVYFVLSLIENFIHVHNAFWLSPHTPIPFPLILPSFPPLEFSISSVLLFLTYSLLSASSIYMGAVLSSVAWVASLLKTQQSSIANNYSGVGLSAHLSLPCWDSCLAWTCVCRHSCCQLVCATVLLYLEHTVWL